MLLTYLPPPNAHWTSYIGLLKGPHPGLLLRRRYGGYLFVGLGRQGASHKVGRGLRLKLSTAAQRKRREARKPKPCKLHKPQGFRGLEV